MGTTYKDIRKTHCDLNLFKQVRKHIYKPKNFFFFYYYYYVNIFKYMECLKKRDDFASLEKKFHEVSEKYYVRVSILKNYLWINSKF